MNDKDFLNQAIGVAKESVKQGGFPAGAIIVKDGKIIGKGISVGILHNDPTAHAEVTAIRDACKNLETLNLEGATLYETLAGCTMCFSAANWAGVSRIVYGANKSNEMVSKNYYEGSTDTNKLNKENNREMEMVYLADFENEILELVKNWEIQNV